MTRTGAVPEPPGPGLSRVSGHNVGRAAARGAVLLPVGAPEPAKHFDAKGPFWRPFLKGTQLTPERRADIEAKLREVNDLVVASHGSFEQVCDRLKKVQDVVPLASGDGVSIEAVPGRLFDLLAKAQINLGTTTGAKIRSGATAKAHKALSIDAVLGVSR